MPYQSDHVLLPRLPERQAVQGQGVEQPLVLVVIAAQRERGDPPVDASVPLVDPPRRELAEPFGVG